MTGESGTLQLMRDLGDALATDSPQIMLGGGNPGSIPAVQELFRARLQALAHSPDELNRTIGLYDGQRGDQRFLESMARLLRTHFGWPIGPENIAITNGSQSAFFFLFNLFAGTHADGTVRRILLPLAPEYIGYADQGVEPNLFVARKPRIELLDDSLFKYRLDFENFEVPDDIGAICVSRPTNPTGNVLTEAELEMLMALARERDIPLLIDNAYGTPFPDIIFRDAKPVFSRHSIICLSLSKLGLPGVRTGIVVGAPEVIEAVGAMNAIVSLASNSLGPALVSELVDSGEIINVSRTLIRPFYQQRARVALDWLRTAVAGLPCRIHKPEGAFFFWLWCKDIPVPSAELYQRLKRRGVVVVAGHHFFPGLDEPWQHKYECIRINYSGPEADVRAGLKIIGEEVRAAYSI